MPQRRPKGFTLIELLVVIAIIAILIGLLVPAVQKVRESANVTQCLNNLKQIGVALHNYHDSHGALPSGHVETQDGSGNYHYGTNWAISILPYVEQENLYRSYNSAVDNQDRSNQAFAQTYVPIYACPSDPNFNKVLAPETIGPNGGSQPNPPLLFMTGSYKAMSGVGDASSANNFGGYWNQVQAALHVHPAGRGAFHGDGASMLRPERFGNVKDGLSNTIFVGERHTTTHASRGAFWADSFNLYSLGASWPYSSTLLADYDLCKSQVAENFCKYGWGSVHPGGINFLFGDGSVRSIPVSIDMDVFMALSTINGGEVIPDF
jgi:prepilin-type N-terminal cleavage/methylation domain-containing protein/prepilin-type processing-associated H-X9-DG protein